MKPTEQDKELRTLLRTLLGEMPNFVIDWLELSDKLRQEWKKGGKASDFGGHRAFIQKYEEKLAKLIAADRKRVALEARLDELKLHRYAWVLFGDRPPYKGESVSLPILLAHYDDRIAELKAQQEEV